MRHLLNLKHDNSSRKRTWVKGLSFEIVSNLVGLGLAYWWFGNFTGCVAYTVVCFFLKCGLFYYHERVWHQIPWGHEQSSETQHA